MPPRHLPDDEPPVLRRLRALLDQAGHGWLPPRERTATEWDADAEPAGHADAASVAEPYAEIAPDGYAVVPAADADVGLVSSTDTGTGLEHESGVGRRVRTSADRQDRAAFVRAAREGSRAQAPHHKAAGTGPVAVRVRPRLDPGPRGAAALALVALVAAVLAGVLVLRSRPQAVPVTAPPVTSTAPASAPAASARASATPSAAPVVVAVSGRVARPGLVELPAGSRVDDAVRAAGGALPGTDLSTINLARRLQDGEQVAVGVAPAADAGGGGGGGGGGGAVFGGSGSASAVVDLNAATLEQLETLPGVGPVLAQHLLDFRQQHGRFTSVDQLRQVAGIGESKYAQLKDRVRV